MSQAHIDGILALLTGAGLTAYDTESEEAPPHPHVILAASSLSQVSESLCDTPLDFHDYIRITATGTGPEQARWAQSKAFAALDRKHPVVAGYLTHLKRTATGILAVDHDISLPGAGHPVYTTDTYLYRATPSA